jgi:proteic killer suppression protein
VIQSFTDKITEALFHGIHTHAIRKQLSSNQVKSAEYKLDLLNAAETLESLETIPSLQGEAGVRDAHGKYSIPITQDWRLAFTWSGGPGDVELKPN